MLPSDRTAISTSLIRTTYVSASTPDGIITTIAGSVPHGSAAAFAGDGGPATQARLAGPFGVTVNAAGDIFIADTNNNRIRAVRSPLPGSSGSAFAIASEDGDEVYAFGAEGRIARPSM